MALTVLDAGVIIAVLDAADAHHEASREAMRAAAGDHDALILPASAYAEVLVAPFRASDNLAERVDSFLDAVPVEIRPPSRDICRRAARLRAEHGNRLRLPDALVVATAIELDADRLITTDGRWPTILRLSVQALEPA